MHRALKLATPFCFQWEDFTGCYATQRLLSVQLTRHDMLPYSLLRWLSTPSDTKLEMRQEFPY